MCVCMWQCIYVCVCVWKCVFFCVNLLAWKAPIYWPDIWAPKTFNNSLSTSLHLPLCNSLSLFWKHGLMLQLCSAILQSISQKSSNSLYKLSDWKKWNLKDLFQQINFLICLYMSAWSFAFMWGKVKKNSLAKTIIKLEIFFFIFREKMIHAIYKVWQP